MENEETALHYLSTIVRNWQEMLSLFDELRHAWNEAYNQDKDLFIRIEMLPKDTEHKRKCPLKCPDYS